MDLIVGAVAVVGIGLLALSFRSLVRDVDGEVAGRNATSVSRPGGQPEFLRGLFDHKSLSMYLDSHGVDPTTKEHSILARCMEGADPAVVAKQVGTDVTLVLNACYSASSDVAELIQIDLLRAAKADQPFGPADPEPTTVMDLSDAVRDPVED